MKTLVTICLTVIALGLYAEGGKEAQSDFGKNFLPVWEVSTNHTMDVAKAMPEELYGFKPNDSSKTFAEQLIHIAGVTQGLAKGFILGEKGGPTPDASTMSKAEIIDFMEKSFATATDAISGMTEAQANEVIKVFGGKEVTRYIAVMFIQDHLANHRAKANLYIRMNDIVPPRYSFF